MNVVWEVWDPKSQPLSDWRILNKSTTIIANIWYIYIYIIYIYIDKQNLFSNAPQPRMGFEGLTSYSTRISCLNAALFLTGCLRFSAWRSIGFGAGIGRRGSICIDLLALFSSPLLPANTDHANHLDDEANALTLRIHPFRQVAAFSWLKWLWKGRHVHSHCSGTSGIDVQWKWTRQGPEGPVFACNSSGTVCSADSEVRGGPKLKNLGRHWGAVVNHNFDAR